MFAVQDKTGLVEDANAYVSVAKFRQYFTDRGIDTSSYLDAKVEGAIAQATRFMDVAFDFLGYQLTGITQRTQFPRYMTTAPDPLEAEIPREVEESCCEYTIYVLSGKVLIMNIAPSDQGISELDKEIEGIKKRVKYIGSLGDNPIAVLPFAELLLAKSGWLYIRKNVVIRT